MKKFIAFSALLLCCLFLVGCTATVAPVSIDTKKPWNSRLSANRESAVYSVQKIAHNESNEDGTSSPVNILTEDSQWSYVLIENESDFTLETKLTLTYISATPVLQSMWGKTDTIITSATFRKDNLNAIKSSRTVTLETDSLHDYSFEADYSTLSATVTTKEGQKTFTFERDAYIDNEMLFFYVRAISDLKEGYSKSLAVVNWYECYLADRFSASELVVNVAATKSSIKLESELLQGFADDGIDSDNSTLACYRAAIGLSGNKGVPFNVDYATVPFSSAVWDEPANAYADHYTKKVIAKISSFEYSLSGKLTFTTEYTLKEFTNPVVE